MSGALDLVLTLQLDGLAYGLEALVAIAAAVAVGMWLKTLRLRRAADQRARERDTARAAFERLAEAIDECLYSFELRPDGSLANAYQGPGVERLLGGPVPEGMDSARAWLSCLDSDGLEADAAAVRRALEEGSASFEVDVHGYDGRTRAIRVDLHRERLEGGRTIIHGVARDRSREREAADALERHALVLRETSDAVLTIAPDGTIVYANAAAHRLGAGGDPTGCTLLPLVAPASRDGVQAGLERDVRRGSVRGAEVAMLTVDGERVYSWHGWFDPERGLPTYIGRDITLQALAHEAARTDPLTLLPNRRVFQEAARAELARAARTGSTPGLVLVDVDHFKRVNDAHGHAAGDEVLVELGRRLRAAVREYDTVARWGGEELCVLVAGDCSPDEVEGVAIGLCDAVRSEPFQLSGGGELQVTISAGCALALPQVGSVEGWVDAADRALYAAKRRGRDRVHAAWRVSGDDDLVYGEPEQVRVAQAFALAAGARDGAPPEHARAVADLSASIARELGLDESVVMRCRLAGWLHEVGKLAIPERVLRKRAQHLDAEDWAVLRSHPRVGASLVRRVPGLAEAAPGVQHQHERVDGHGYPDGLAGARIPIEARVVAVADAWAVHAADELPGDGDALTHVLASAGTELDADVVAALRAVLAARGGP